MRKRSAASRARRGGQRVRYAQFLLEAARSGERFIRPGGGHTAASTFKRWEEGTPLNDRERVAFATLLLDERMVTEIDRMVNKVIGSGRSKYSMDTIIETLRWNTEIEQGIADDGFKLNDHIAATCARLWNEQIDRPLFECRPIEGEPSYRKRKARSDDELFI